MPEKLCGWAPDALNYLPHEFWKKSDQKFRAWTLQETLYFSDVRLSSSPQFYEDAFERYLIEKEEYEKDPLHCEVDRPLFRSYFVDREELPRQYRIPKSVKKKNVQVTANRAKSVMTEKLKKGFSTKRWSVMKAVGFGVKAVLEEKPDVRDGRQRSISKLNNSLSSAQTVDDIDGSQSFDYDGEMEKKITTKPISEIEKFREMMDRCIARWDKCNNMKTEKLRSETDEENFNSKLEFDAT